MKIVYFIFKKIYLWLCWVSGAVHRLSPDAVSGGCPPVVAHGLLIVVASPVEHTGSRASGFK